MRPLFLYFMMMASAARRVLFDFGRELATLVASAVLFATFMYVFDDFLNVQVKGLSPAMRERFALYSAVLVGVLGVTAAARALRAGRTDERAFSSFARYVGEEKSVLMVFGILRTVTILIFFHGAAWLVAARFLVVPPGSTAAWTELGALAASVILATIWPLPREKSAADAAALFSAVRGLATERLLGVVGAWHARLLGKNRAARVAFIFAMVFLALSARLAFSGLPLFVPSAAALAAGILAGSGLMFQLADDLETAWTERALGLSHSGFVAAGERLAGFISAQFFLLAAIATGAAQFAAQVIGANVTPDLSGILKVGAMAGLPPLITPYLGMQIDGKRPAVNIMVLVIVGLFLGTAIFASWFSVVLIPLLRHYALKTQDGRFYRA